MAAPKGNQFWKLASKYGRDRLFATPDLMWEAALEYFDWCDKHPWKQVKSKKGGRNNGEVETTPVQRPYTISGLMLYFGACEAYWRQFKSQNHKEFFTVISRIDSIIETQQLEGAVVGTFNANIIARKLGLADKQDNSVTVKGDIPIKDWIKSKAK